jgi:hypothetical protein
MTGKSIHSVDQLLALPVEEFVKACYSSLLFRPADPAGLLHYVGVVAKGESKLAVAAAIASSDEARALPSHRKRLVTEVLARHASALIENARTHRSRQRAARRMETYLATVSGLRIAGQQEGGSGEADPFASYLTCVIQDRS